MLLFFYNNLKYLIFYEEFMINLVCFCIFVFLKSSKLNSSIMRFSHIWLSIGRIFTYEDLARLDIVSHQIGSILTRQLRILDS